MESTPEPSPSLPCSTDSCSSIQSTVDRRQFLFGAGATVVMLALPKLGSGQVAVQRAEFPRKKIGVISELKSSAPISFRYPFDHENATNYLVQLNEEAGGGIGPEKNIVAFNGLCTHQGISMEGTFDSKAGIAGPCPLHWTSFDLSRHGTVIAGHATMALPQIILEADGDDIYAIGVQGLFYGYTNNTSSA